MRNKEKAWKGQAERVGESGDWKEPIQTSRAAALILYPKCQQSARVPGQAPTCPAGLLSEVSPPFQPQLPSILLHLLGAVCQLVRHANTKGSPAWVKMEISCSAGRRTLIHRVFQLFETLQCCGRSQVDESPWASPACPGADGFLRRCCWRSQPGTDGLGACCFPC